MRGGGSKALMARPLREELSVLRLPLVNCFQFMYYKINMPNLLHIGESRCDGYKDILKGKVLSVTRLWRKLLPFWLVSREIVE